MWAIARLAIFIVATLGIIYLSRTSLRQPRSHGFYRFFVFEAILAQFLINLPVWFRDPLSWHQIASWILLVISFVPLVLGVQALHGHGRKGSAPRQEPGLLEFERTTVLIRDGIFRYIRHPMYCSLLLLNWGLFFKAPTGMTAILALLTTVGVLLMARAEESEMVQAFGDEYRDYLSVTKRFLPFVY